MYVRTCEIGVGSMYVCRYALDFGAIEVSTY